MLFVQAGSCQIPVAIEEFDRTVLPVLGIELNNIISCADFGMEIQSVAA